MSTISEKYLIIEKLGKQTNRKFGSVFLAKEKTSGVTVIVKTNSGINENSVESIQLRKERCFTFNDPGLPHVLDFYEMGHELFLVKKFQQGIPLDEYWTSIKRKDQIIFLNDFLFKLSAILNRIHQQNIFHCDLKPSNILINSNDNEFNIELIDFGLAVQQPIQENRKLIFPLGYAAPELILNQLNEINRTSDYFSIGIIIWKLFNGMLPLCHSNPSIYTNLQLTHPIEDSTRLPKGLFQILSKLTVKPAFKTSPNRMKKEDVIAEIRRSQKNRYQSLEELMNDLESIKPRKIFGLF